MDIGGKAKSLDKLQSAGFRVPPFFVCDESWSEKKVLQTIDKKLSGISFFVVRSSACGEDGENKSYAGQFYSSIAVRKSCVIGEFKKVLASFGGLKGSVIIQKFIPSDASGVVFSDTGKGVVVINSNFGLCKNVVEGKACDEYLANKNGSLISESISKDKPVLLFQNGSLKEVKKSSQSLSEEQIIQVVELAIKSEKYFNKPQDVEWCFHDNALYLLQSRPITKVIDIPEQVYFDSANIAESYSGVVLPLTASFAERIYSVVYTDFLRMSGVSKKMLKKHSYVFKNLLGFFHGRMYYNMNNWYRLAQFVPGYKRNKENFETMITSNLRQEISTTIRPGFLFKIVYPVIVLVKVLSFAITEKRFRRYIEKHIKNLKKTNFDKLSLEECKDFFGLLENDLLHKWYVTLENDFFVMTYLGVLQKLYPKENLQEILIFKSKATEQVDYLMKLSKLIQRDSVLWKALQDKDCKKFEVTLAKRLSVKKQYDKYLEKFGGRFANELKLETIGIDEDIEKLMTVLRAYKSYVPHNVAKKSTETIKLSVLKKVIFNHSLKKFKKYASQREDFRLFRSNMFSITRSVFRRVGVILKEQGVIKHSDDVFYIFVEEVLQIADGQEILDLHAKILKRKQTYSEYQLEKPPAHFLSLNGEMIGEREQENPKSVTARGVSAGIVSGRVKVMKEFEMPDKVDFEILVTRHTDPGWTALIALSKGIIIEHGGVLSHASIVARELGIPAVIGARGATDLYIDGQEVEINGSTGKIKYI